MDGQDYAMPFGRHKGSVIFRLPNDYLAWCEDNLKDVHPSLKQAIADELQFRHRHGRSSRGLAERHSMLHGQTHRSAPPPSPEPDSTEVEEIHSLLKVWRRHWLMVLHPDRGGTEVAFKTFHAASADLWDRLQQRGYAPP